MYNLDVRNVHEALPAALDLITRHGKERDSRNGPVLVMDGPVTTTYRQPRERVIFWEQRDANPFFHLFESLWMLAGRNDVAYLTQFVNSMSQFSDDGVVFHGAYGFRWRQMFVEDQLKVIVEALKKNHDDRRQVLQMWDVDIDLGGKGKDLPCNTHIYFSVNMDGALDMTVCNRSNDIVWGAYGANAVHFSILQEYMASFIGVPVGRYFQMSNNYHGYLKTVTPLIQADILLHAPDPHRVHDSNPYKVLDITPYPLVSEGMPMERWDEELKIFLESGHSLMGCKEPFFKKVATPLAEAHSLYKKSHKCLKLFEEVQRVIDKCEAQDWKVACSEWIERRKVNFLKAGNDGPSY